MTFSVYVKAHGEQPIEIHGSGRGQLGQHGYLNVHDQQFSITHQGQPRQFPGMSKKWDSDAPIAIEYLYVRTPLDHFPLGYPLNGAQLMGEDGSSRLWQILGPDVEKDSPDPQFPITSDYHALLGGERFHVVFRNINDWHDELPSFERVAEIAKLLDFDPEPLGSSRFMEAFNLFSLQGVDDDVSMYSRMIPAVWDQRTGGRLKVDGPFRSGDVHWPEGHMNGTYAMPGHFMVNALMGVLAGNVTDETKTNWTIAMWLARSQASMGVIHSVGNRFHGAQLYEKGLYRRGSSFYPAVFKQWVWPTYLLKEFDPSSENRDAWDARVNYFLNYNVANWSGMYGERNAELMLNNFRFIAKVEPHLKAQMEAKASAVIEKCLGFAAQMIDGRRNLWFANIERMPNLEYKPWMQGPVLSAIYNWCYADADTGQPFVNIDEAQKEIFDACVGAFFSVLRLRTINGEKYLEVPYSIQGRDFRYLRGGSPHYAAVIHHVLGIVEKLEFVNVVVLDHDTGAPVSLSLEEAKTVVQRTAFDSIGSTFRFLGDNGGQPLDAPNAWYGQGMGSSTPKSLSFAMDKALYGGTTN